MRTLISRTATAFSLAIAVSSLSAGTLTTAALSVNGTPVDVQGITGFTTLGSGMAGLNITATFLSGGPSSTCVWAATTATAGGCSTPLFTMTLDGDTFNAPWVFSTTPGGSPVASLFFDGVPGGVGTRTSGTVFDRTFGGAIGTDGTSTGKDANGTTTGDDGTATYQDVLTIGGAATSGDVYGRVLIRFGADGITAANFVMDTDSVGLPGGVPEPSTWAMLGGALLGLGLMRSRGK